MRLHLFLLLILLSFSLHAQETILQPSRADQNLKGNVMKVISVQKYISGTDMNFEEQWDYEQNGSLATYLRRGFGGEHVTNYPQRKPDDPLRHTDYDRDGDPITTWAYNSNHQLLTSKHYIYGAGGTLAVIIEYSYDPEQSGVVITRRLYQYDKNTRLTDVYLYSVDETPLMEEHYKYDKHGNLVSTIRTVIDDQERTDTREQRKYRYDKQGNWIHCDYFHNGNHISSTDRTITYF